MYCVCTCSLYGCVRTYCMYVCIAHVYFCMQIFYPCVMWCYTDRTERDRGLLQSKLRSAHKAQSTASHAAPRTGYTAHGQLPPRGGMVESVVPGQSLPQEGTVRSTPTVLQLHSEEVHQLKKRVFELENEVSYTYLRMYMPPMLAYTHSMCTYVCTFRYTHTHTHLHGWTKL